MRVLISGGGIGGLTLALKLLKFDINVKILEKSTKPSIKYKGELLQPKSLLILEELGVIDSIIKHGHKIDRTIVKEMSSGNEQEAQWDYTILNHKYNFALMVPHEKLKEILLEACLNIDPDCYLKGTKFLSFSSCSSELKEEAVIERKGNIEKISSDFFIGAEGRISPVRKEVGIELRKKKYNHHFLTVSFPKPPSLTDATIITKQDQLLGLFPISHERVRTVLLIKPGEYKQMIRKGLSTFYTKYLNLMPDMAGYVNQIKGFKEIQLMIPVAHHASTYVKGNVAIIGDAAHSVHPMAGEGMNLAIQDADVLGELFRWMQDNNTLDPTLLKWFENVRRPRVKHVSSISHQSALVYSYSFSFWRQFRINVLKRIEQSDRLHFKQILNISGLGEWQETVRDRLAQAGVAPPKPLSKNFNQADYFYTQKDDYPWRK